MHLKSASINSSIYYKGKFLHEYTKHTKKNYCWRCSQGSMAAGKRLKMANFLDHDSAARHFLNRHVHTGYFPDQAVFTSGGPSPYPPLRSLIFFDVVHA